MSRHASTFAARPRTRVVGVVLATVLALTALLPAAVAAQGDEITPQDIQWEWQLLTQLDADRNMEDVPAGVGATLLLRSGAASGEAACSTYDSSYSNSADVLNVFVEPDEIHLAGVRSGIARLRRVFYPNLGGITSIRTAADVLVVRDEIGEDLMTFTRATIDNDPTASRWSLARIGGADGSVEPVIQGLTAWMEFLRGGSLVGSTGCGSFLGKYDTNEGRIDITDVVYATRCLHRRAPVPRRSGSWPRSPRSPTSRCARPAWPSRTSRAPSGWRFTPDLDLARRTWTPTAIYDQAGRQRYGSGNELTTSAVQFIGGKFEGRSICRPFAGDRPPLRPGRLRSGSRTSSGSPKRQGR